MHILKSKGGISETILYVRGIKSHTILLQETKSNLIKLIFIHNVATIWFVSCFNYIFCNNISLEVKVLSPSWLILVCIKIVCFAHLYNFVKKMANDNDVYVVTFWPVGYRLLLAEWGSVRTTWDGSCRCSLNTITSRPQSKCTIWTETLLDGEICILKILYYTNYTKNIKLNFHCIISNESVI